MEARVRFWAHKRLPSFVAGREQTEGAELLLNTSLIGHLEGR